jgi:hypothetical protein
MKDVMCILKSIISDPRATEGESIFLPWLGVHLEVCQNLYVYFFLVNT